MCCIIINNYYRHGFYAGASCSDTRGNPIPRCDINKLIDWLTFDWLAQTLERNNMITYQAKGQKVDNKKINKW